MHPVKRTKLGNRSEDEDTEACDNNMALGRCGKFGGRVRSNGASMEVEKRNVQA